MAWVFWLLSLSVLRVGTHGSAPVATILCYHEVDPPDEDHKTVPRQSAGGDEASEQRRYTANPDAFRAQLDYLAANGYHVVPLAQLVAALRGEQLLPPKAVVITVDDGWSCARTEVFEELRRRNMPFTLFVYPHIVGRGSHAVRWPDVEEMARAGVDIESHSFTHPFLTRKPAELLTHELADSRKAIEQHTKKPVHFLAYPFGDYDERVLRAAEDNGYVAAVTTKRGPVTPETSPMELPRYLIHNDTTLDEFNTFLPAADQAGSLMVGFSSRGR